MGWRDAPVVSTASWRDAPIVEQQLSGAESLAKETPSGEAALVAMGRTFDRLGQGAKQAALEALAFFGNQASKTELGEMAKREDEKSRLFAPLAAEHPIATTIGAAAPLMAAPALGGGIAGMAVGAALPGLVEYGSAGERLQRGALGGLGGAVGGAIGKAVSRVPQPIKPNLTQSQQSAQAAAERLGVRLTPGEMTGSKPLRWAESALADLPFSGGMATKADTARKAAMNQAAARAIGQSAPEITDDVLAAARQQIGGEFERILTPLEVPLDKTFQTEVRAITGSKVMKELRDDSVESLLAPFRSLPSGVKAKGDWFQQNRTALDDAVRAAYSAGQTGKAKALERFEDALHRAAMRGMSDADREAYNAARKQWANLRILESGKVVDGGNVVPHRVESALISRYKQAYKEGKIKGELPDIAAAGHAMRALPQSGTVPRAAYSGAALGAAFAEPMTAALSMTGPTLAQKFLQSDIGRQYLTKGLLNVSPEAERIAELIGAGLLSAPSTLSVR